MLSEARIILPLKDNDGNSTEAARAIIAGDILDAFGGYSESPVVGAWKSPEGRVYRDVSAAITIAGEWNDANRYALHLIAQKAAEELRQECIYLAINGQVQFVEPAVALAA